MVTPDWVIASKLGILPGWHGMKNGQKPEMEKKWKSKWKTAPSWTGTKMAKKWPKNGKLPQKSIFWPFFCHFCPSSLGPFSISISIFFPFPVFGRFPCHASPAGSQIKASPPVNFPGAGGPSGESRDSGEPRGPNDQNNLISIEIFNLDRNFHDSHRRDRI